MDLSRALALAADGRDRALADLIELARIPSVSTDPAYAGDVARAADWLAERLRALGLDVSVEPGDPHPVVCAEWIGRPGAPVLGLYSHYDVQPPDPLELWDSGPFDPVVRDGALVARGVRDDKGQLVAGPEGGRVCAGRWRAAGQPAALLRGRGGDRRLVAGQGAARRRPALALRLRLRGRRAVRRAGSPDGADRTARRAAVLDRGRGARDGPALGSVRRRRAQPDQRADAHPRRAHRRGRARARPRLLRRNRPALGG